MPPRQRYRYRFCDAALPVWLPVPNVPDRAMWLYHLSQQHPDQVGPDLERMRTECISTVAVEA